MCLSISGVMPNRTYCICSKSKYYDIILRGLALSKSFEMTSLVSKTELNSESKTVTDTCEVISTRLLRAAGDCNVADTKSCVIPNGGCKCGAEGSEGIEGQFCSRVEDVYTLTCTPDAVVGADSGTC